MMYWNWETEKMAKFSSEATGSEASAQAAAPQYSSSPEARKVASRLVLR